MDDESEPFHILVFRWLVYLSLVSMVLIEILHLFYIISEDQAMWGFAVIALIMCITSTMMFIMASTYN